MHLHLYTTTPKKKSQPGCLAYKSGCWLTVAVPYSVQSKQLGLEHPVCGVRACRIRGGWGNGCYSLRGKICSLGEKEKRGYRGHIGSRMASCCGKACRRCKGSPITDHSSSIGGPTREEEKRRETSGQMRFDI